MNSSKDVSKQIESLLNELADTQSKLALRQVRSLLYAGFEKQSDGYGEAVTYVPKMIDIALDRSVVQPGTDPNDATGMQTVSTTVQVPLVTLMPIKLLGVKKVQLSNELDEDYLEDQEGQNLSINVTYDECALPEGLKSLLNELAKSIGPV